MRFFPRPACRTLVVAGLTVALTFLVTGRARATNELNDQIRLVSWQIKTFLDTRGEKALTIGQFVSPPQRAANPGPGLALLLGRQLKEHKVAVKGRAKFGIHGEFREVNDEGKPLSMELKINLVDETNRPLKIFSAAILNPADIAFLVGANTRFPARGDRKAKGDKLRRDLKKSPVVVQGTRVSVGPDRPYSVEVRVGNSPRRPTLEDGMPYLKINNGEIYTIRLGNNTDKETAVELTIDGVNVFAFNEDPDASGRIRGDYRVILKPRGSAVIKGWYRAKGQNDSFMVTDYPDTAAFLKNSTDGVGIITASFCSTWKEEPRPLVTLGDSGMKSGTGFGPRVEQRYRTLERVFGEVSAVISIRYAKD
jgi:hypothetical protein